MSAALGASGALTAQLALVTTPQPVSLLPQDLNTTNNIITDILSVLEAGLEEGNASDSSSVRGSLLNYLLHDGCCIIIVITVIEHFVASFTSNLRML